MNSELVSAITNQRTGEIRNPNMRYRLWTATNFGWQIDAYSQNFKSIAKKRQLGVNWERNLGCSWAIEDARTGSILEVHITDDRPTPDGIEVSIQHRGVGKGTIRIVIVTPTPNRTVFDSYFEGADVVVQQMWQLWNVNAETGEILSYYEDFDAGDVYGYTRSFYHDIFMIEDGELFLNR